jgi:hypothetical protein
LIFKAVKKASPTTTKADDLVPVDDDKGDHADLPQAPPARRKKKKVVSWIQCDLMEV